MADATLFAGLISGTSADGIDAALVNISDRHIETLATLSHPMPHALAQDVATALTDPDILSARRFGDLDARLGDAFADAAAALFQRAGVTAAQVRAIGSHGQTLLHAADATPAFTLQAGDPARIAGRTGTTVVADFRRADVAAGGEGAPLAPLIHAAMLADPNTPRAIINLGGIANVTTLIPGRAVLGFDTGPANTLMDLWARQTQDERYDRGGAMAARGRVDKALLHTLCDDPYFRRPPPKSTGREHFNSAWLTARLPAADRNHRDAQTQRSCDVMATLCALTAVTVADALRDAMGDALATSDVFVCGGGCHNATLMAALADALARPISSTAEAGIDPDFVEAILFGWLAAQRVTHRHIDTRTMTGASTPVIAGAIYEPPGSDRE